MTDSLARLMALPFALILLFCFTQGGLDTFGIKTILVLLSLIALMLIYIFNKQINEWWWKRRSLVLDRPLIAWLKRFSPYFQSLSDSEQLSFQGELAKFMKLKNFTLKGKRDYQVEEDIKLIIAHEFLRVFNQHADQLYQNYDQIVVYNHPFGTPEIPHLHTVELFREDEVIILSKEQLVNGFVDPARYVNVGLLAAVMIFIELNPRLNYPDTSNIQQEEIARNFQINLDAIYQATGLPYINKLDLLIFCYFLSLTRSERQTHESFDMVTSIFHPEK